MNILLSVQNMGLGGVTTYVLHLASGLSKKHKVIIYDHNPYFFDPEFCNWLPENVSIESVKIHTFSDKLIWKVNAFVKKLGFSFSVWEYLKNLHFKKTLRKYQVELITSFDKFSDRIVVDLAGDKLPIVLSLHGSYDISEFNHIPEREIHSYEDIFRRVKAIIYKADCNIKILENYSDLSNILLIKKIFHGFTFNKPISDPQVLRKQLGIKATTFVYGMIGRGVPEKGWKEALEAFADLQERSEKEIHFVALGGSPYLSDLSIKFKNIPNIHFTGFVENNIEWINIFDVGLLPTYAKTENFTFSIVEYLYCGKPSVATNHGEISTTLDADGKKAGILIQLKNGRPDVLELSKAMQVYLDDERIYREHSLLAPVALKKFESEKAISEYEEVFSLVLKRKDI